MWDDEGRFDDVCARGEQGLESLEGGVSPGEGKKTLYIGNLKTKIKKKILISNPPGSQERGFSYPPCFFEI